MKNTEKALVAYDFDLRTSTERRLTLSFISVDKYDSKQLSAYLDYVRQHPRFFLSQLEVKPFDPPSSLFRVYRVKFEL